MKLMEARLELGLGRIRAAKLCGMDKAELYKIETGRRVPRAGVALRIARALGLDPHAVEEFEPALGDVEALGLIMGLPEAVEVKPTHPLSAAHLAAMAEARQRVSQQQRATTRRATQKEPKE
jgi:transcriptional regulator with XRE-family HTH domain